MDLFCLSAIFYNILGLLYMPNLILILGDQLSESITSLKGYNPDTDVILMCESWEEMTYVKHHKKKIAFILSAMRHFSETLKHKNYKVKYIKLDDTKNTKSIKGEVVRLLKKQTFKSIIVTQPSEYHIFEDMRSWENELAIHVEIRQDDRFLCTTSEFSSWAKDRKQLRMEFFYREMRKKYDILMKDNNPIGGQWNYDMENRKPPKDGLNIPLPYISKTDSITQEVISLVSQRFDDHFGDLEPFYFAVTRADALQVLNQFIERRLNYFGDYQDAMVQGEAWMYHSHISFYLNCGLLLPLECIHIAEKAYRNGTAPINSVEGFIRQIIGWREYIRGIYWLKMPEYADENFFDAKRSLPDFYWTGNTKMNCLSQTILETKQNSYAHHIQRLMVLGNFALLAGINPKEVNEWFLVVYADAYEWVELPNVSGMILFADGGYLASKPYAAGGSYINKMSNYCKNCSYKVTKKNGLDACPFNYLYWNFLDHNRAKLAGNPHISMMYKVFDRMDTEKQATIREDSEIFLVSLE